MGLLSGLMGNASEVDQDDLDSLLDDTLVDGESVQKAYKVIRDMFIFTNKRLILIDKQGLTGRKVNYHSIPYKSITQFVVETAGHFDTDAELKIWLSGKSDAIEIELSKASAQDVQKNLANQMFA